MLLFSKTSWICFSELPESLNQTVSLSSQSPSAPPLQRLGLGGWGSGIFQEPVEGDKAGNGWPGCTQPGREPTDAGTPDLHRLVEHFVRGTTYKTEQTRFTGMMVRARHEIIFGKHTFPLEYQAYERIRWDSTLTIYE